jgi:cyanophycin synthetase
MLKICDFHIYKDRNIYSHGQVVKMVVDLCQWADIPTKDIEGFNENLLEMLPGLREHGCSSGNPGGFVNRLKEGTYLAHVIEHTALEIQNTVGCPVNYGIARQAGDSDSVYNIIYAYKNEAAGIESGKLAIHLIEKLCSGQSLDLQPQLNIIKNKAKKCQLGPSTKAIYDAAKKRGIPITRIGNDSILQLGYGKYNKRIKAAIAEDTSCIAVDISCDKSITKHLLNTVGIPVPKGDICTTPDEAVTAAEILDCPVVIKPKSGNQGKGVSLNLSNDEEIIEAFTIAKKVDDDVIVEEYVKGRDYRILVVNNKVVAAAERIPARITGDGKNTINSLIKILNSDKLRGEGHEKPLTKVKINDDVLRLLRKQGYTLDSIPQPGIAVYLKENGNLSTGGEAIDCTNKIHPANRDLAIRAAGIIGLNIAGVDMICEDISKPIENDSGAIVEVNASPGLRMHHYPGQGKVRDAAGSIVDMLYPPGTPFSIPIVSITGTNGKTTTSRMISHILRMHGLTVGMAVTGGVYINNQCIMKGDTTGPASAQIVLTDKNVEAAVLETARGGIIRSGLGYDLSDVGVMTNISEDHLGIDGINSLEDMLHVKSLVVEAVKDNGWVVLNADDPIVVQAAERVHSKIIYFSMEEDNIIVRKHIAEGGKAVFQKNDYITIVSNNEYIQSLPISEIPAALEGRLIYNVANSLAAIAAGIALKIPVTTIERALRSFYTDEFHNPGRAL